MWVHSVLGFLEVILPERSETEKNNQDHCADALRYALMQPKRFTINGLTGYSRAREMWDEEASQPIKE